MTEETKIPEWAFDEANRRARAESNYAPGATYSNAIAALARMIAAHEQPPVDRATRIAREMLARWAETNKKGTDISPTSLSTQIRDGAWDNLGDFRRARDFLAEELGDD